MQLYISMLKFEKKSYFSLARAVYETVVANVSYALTTHFTISCLLCLKVQNWQGTFTYSNEYLTILNYTSCPSYPSN